MAQKEAYYFSHDSNSQDDPKCMILIDQLGMEGYGIFWALIERLRNEKEYFLPISIISALAKRWCTSKEKVESVIKNYKLFSVENDIFFSVRLKESMELKSSKARESISKRWENTTVLRLNNERNTNDIRNDTSKVKESKGKKRKRGVKVISFDATGNFAVLSDGSKQKLTLSEKIRHNLQDLKPEDIIL